MSQEFHPHPILVNYEASRDGIVRHCILKNPIGCLSNMGYLMFSVRKKKYYIHREVYKTFNGPIKDGLVIDHRNGDITDNRLENLQAVTQSENTKKGRTGISSKAPKPIRSFNISTQQEMIFRSMNEAARYFDICMPSVRNVAEGIYRTARSKSTGERIKFSYHKGDNS